MRKRTLTSILVVLYYVDFLGNLPASFFIALSLSFESDRSD